MRINELKKGDKVQMRSVGEVEVLGVTRNYIRLKAPSMTMKLIFACNTSPIGNLGLTVEMEVKNGNS